MKHAISYKPIALLVLVGSCLSCRHQAGTTRQYIPQPPPVITQGTQSQPPRTQNALALCDQVSQIKQLPFEDERGVDPTYDALRDAGESVVPCLIAKVGDTASMPDPRMAPRYAGIDNKVGDVALWVLERITSVDVLQFLPRKVQNDFKEEGVLAYFKYVRDVQHRKALQDRLYQWYRQKYGKDARAQTH
jgi:hypothetical protein